MKKLLLIPTLILGMAMIDGNVGQDLMATTAANTAATTTVDIDADFGPRGYWRTIRERHWQAGHHRRVWVEPVYRWRYRACGTRYRHCVRQGHYNRRFVEGCWVYRNRRVWVNNGYDRNPYNGPRSGRRGGRRGGL